MSRPKTTEAVIEGDRKTTLKKGFFEAMGWDLKSGKPDPTTWKQLGLDELEL